MMQIQVLKSKIHRVQITEAQLDYIGSITIDEDLMDAAIAHALSQVKMLVSGQVPQAMNQINAYKPA